MTSAMTRAMDTSLVYQTLEATSRSELVRQAQTIQALEQPAIQQSIVPVSANAAPSAPAQNAIAAMPAEPAVDAFLAAQQVARKSLRWA